MVEVDDKLLEQFFQTARTQQIEDRGFTQRVMRQLPDRALQLSRLWTGGCLLMGVVLFVVFHGWQPVSMGLSSLLHTLVTEVKPVPFFVTMGVLCSLSLLELVHKLDTSDSFGV